MFLGSEHLHVMHFCSLFPKLTFRWIASDLGAVNRSITPWVVVGLHRMMWAPATWRHALVGDLDNEERLQADLEELFMIHGVSID